MSQSNTVSIEKRKSIIISITKYQSIAISIAKDQSIAKTLKYCNKYCKKVEVLQ